MKNKRKTRKLGKTIGGIVFLLCLILIGAGMWYIQDYYHAESSVTDCFDGSIAVTVTDDFIFLDGDGTDDAIIFYPGAKVEYTAYIPMFYELAKQGIDCFLVKMPGNLAIFGVNKATDIMEEYSYEHWYLSGHSLGGAMAGSFAAKHTEQLDGLIFLAAYPTKDLTNSGLSVLSLYGSEDLILNRDNLEAGWGRMPQGYAEYVIAGGNHAGFAYYGEQKGDGIATVTKEEQQAEAVRIIMEFILP